MTNRGRSLVQGEHNAVELPLYNLDMPFGLEAFRGECRMDGIALPICPPARTQHRPPDSMRCVPERLPSPRIPRAFRGYQNGDRGAALEGQVYWSSEERTKCRRTSSSHG